MELTFQKALLDAQGAKEKKDEAEAAAKKSAEESRRAAEAAKDKNKGTDRREGRT